MAEQGLIKKFKVERLTESSRGIDHADCRYFVLDPQHDPIAREALAQYAADALTLGYVRLWKDLRQWLASLPDLAAVPPSQDAVVTTEECEGCLCLTEHDGDYGSAGHAGPCPPHTCAVETTEGTGA